MRALLLGVAMLLCTIICVHAQETKEFLKTSNLLRTDTLLFDFKQEGVLNSLDQVPMQPDIVFDYFPQRVVNMGSMDQLKKTIVAPAILMGVGLYSGNSNTSEGIGKRSIDHTVQTGFEGFQSHADDYLQWGPIAMCYGLQAMGYQGANSTWNSTKLLLKAELLTAVVVRSIKATTKNNRPDSSADSSFPSGHTAQAFVAATFLHREYGHLSKWYSVCGYTMATTVGCMRMMNRRHWFNDVAVGAGLGMALTNLVYWQHDRRNDKKKRNWTAIPSVSDQHASVSMVMQF